jgi:hypothetical protein
VMFGEVVQLLFDQAEFQSPAEYVGVVLPPQGAPGSVPSR